jgi:hypothetical protein
MSNLRVCPINFLDAATLVDTPTMLSTMPVSNLKLTTRSDVARSTSNADQVVKGHWGGATRKINGFFIFGHNGQGGSVRLQLYSDSAYTTQIYDSGTVALFTAITSDGYDFGDASLFNVNDPLGNESPYSLWPGAIYTAQSFKVTFSACPAAYWQINRIFLGKYLELTYNPKYGSAFSPAKSTSTQKRLPGASLLARKRGRYREFRVDLSFIQDDGERALWRDVAALVDVTRDVVISVRPGIGGREERDHVMNAMLSQSPDFVWANPQLHDTTFTFTEV